MKFFRKQMKSELLERITDQLVSWWGLKLLGREYVITYNM